jgi:C4-dicarboxylate-specific signal transduction histidine kinase
MGTKPDIIAETGLQFFGKISASISHELKNVMAIVNENAGLLEDLTAMAEQGRPLDPARLKLMAAAVQKQVGRADEILNNMNRFAHTIDATVAEVDLNQTIELFMALTDRFILMRGVKVDLQLPDQPLKIPTAPYFLINLLWLCLDFAISASGDDKRVSLVAEETEDSIRIRFRQLEGLTEALLKTFPSGHENSLLAVLEAALAAEPERQEIVLRLPRSGL